MVVALVSISSAAWGQDAPRIPLVRGLTMVSALRFPEGDRENVVVVTDASSAGVTYRWRFTERRNGGPEQVAELTRFVRSADLAAAPRLNTVYFSGDQSESPGYTAFSLSTATYDQVSTGKEVAYGDAMIEGPGGLGVIGSMGGIFTTRVLFKGTLSRISTTPLPFPLLVNGRRVTVPVLQLRGRFALRGQKAESDYWVLADREHPLLLRMLSGSDVLQVVRVDVPGAADVVEAALTTSCVAELPGLFFAFNSAELEPASGPALAGAAGLLQRHPEWSLVVQGHTDSVGTASANLALSRRRADAVRAALVRHGVAAGRLMAAGYGASRPRESNATLEGRARNRRVELVRPCAASAAR